jgi:hypothetical protein
VIVLGAVALTAVVLLASLYVLARLITKTVSDSATAIASAVNSVINPQPPEDQDQQETAIQVDLLGEGKGAPDWLPPWEQELEPQTDDPAFKGTTW